MTEVKPKPRKNCTSTSPITPGGPRRVRREYPSPKSELEKTYARLGITREQMEGVALIRPLLKKAGMNSAQVVEVLAGDDSSEAREFMAVYRRMSRNDRRRASLEAIAIAAGLTTRRLWEVISGASMSQGRDVVRLMLTAAQPEIVARSIKSAKMAKGFIDREHLYKAAGFFPTSKGQQIFINNRPVVEESTKQLEEGEDDDVDGTGSLPKMDDFLLDIQKAISPAAKSLPAPVPKVQEAEFTDLPPGALE